MKIELNDSTPVNVPPYRVPLHKREAVEKAVEDMLESGIVRPSISPYNAPVVAVKKPNSDSYRICIDFRAVNSITKPVAQPLDNIDDILASLGKAKYLTKLDLKSAYHNMCLVEEDKEKTAFSVGHQHLEFNRVPFGLVNSGAYFSQLMSIILKGIKGVFVINYLDDILVYSEDFKSHLLHLKEVFRRLRHANLRLNLSKCEFVKTSVEYLGHVIDGNGLRPSPHKVAAIQNAPPPKNVRGVRSFVGLLSYYRRYISKFSEVAEPLINLTRKNTKFIWDDDCQKSFETLKQALQKPPILVFPDITKQFILYCDASDTAVGSVLVQEHDGIEKPVYFLSHSLSQTQRRWPIIEKEAFSIIFSLQRLDFFLSEAQIKFIIRTDHKPLKYFFSARHKNRKLQMWSVALSAYNCEIQFIEGKKNIQADYLSRYANTEKASVNVINTDRMTLQGTVQENEIENSEGHDHVEQDMNRDTETQNFSIPGDFDIVQAQKADTQINQIRQQLVDKTATDHILKHHTIINDTLYYISDSEIKIALRVVIPKTLQKVVLEHFHDSNSHLGIDKTFDLISQRYYWKGLFTDVSNHVAHCVTCNTRGINTNRTPLQPTDIPKFPFEKIAIDTSGPFIQSASGNKYIISVMDIFSSWVEAFPVPDKTAETAAQIILREIIPRYSCPLHILSDNGTEYRNSIFSHICKHLKIHRIHTSIYRPQSNSKIERFHRVMHDLISKHLFQTNEETAWDTYIPFVLSALRTSTNTSTKFSPHFLLYKQDPIMPLDTLLKPRTKYLGDEEHKLNLQRLHIAYTVTRDNIKRSQDKRLERENKTAKLTEFNVGDPVYLFNSGAPSKHSPRWLPYYRVVKQTGKVSYLVRDQISGKLKRVHAQHIKIAKLDKWVIPKRDNRLRKTRLACRRTESSDESEPESDADRGGVMPPQHAYNIPSDSDESITSENIPLAFLPKLQSTKPSNQKEDMKKDTQGDPSIQIENSSPTVTKINPKQVPKRKQEESPEFSTEDNIPLARLRKRLRKETNNEQKFTNKIDNETRTQNTARQAPQIQDEDNSSSSDESVYDDALDDMPDQSYRNKQMETSIRCVEQNNHPRINEDDVSIKKLLILKDILASL